MAADHEPGRVEQHVEPPEVPAQPASSEGGPPSAADASTSAEVPASAEVPTAAEAPAKSRGETAAPKDLIHRTRLSGLWIAIGCFAIILVFLLIFILQNDHKVEISYLGIHGQLTLGIAMLFAALVGIVLTALAGTARILQLRAAARRRVHQSRRENR